MSNADKLMSDFRLANSLFREVYFGEHSTESACERLVSLCLKLGGFVAKITGKTLEDSYPLTMSLVCDIDKAYSFVCLHGFSACY